MLVMCAFGVVMLATVLGVGLGTAVGILSKDLFLSLFVGCGTGLGIVLIGGGAIGVVRDIIKEKKS